LKKGKEEDSVYVSGSRARRSRKPSALKNDLEFSAMDKPLRIILVTGAEAEMENHHCHEPGCHLRTGGQRSCRIVICGAAYPSVLYNRLGMADLFRDNLKMDAVVQQWAIPVPPILSSPAVVCRPTPPSCLIKKMDRILAEIAGWM
jgi:hypothetical protein